MFTILTKTFLVSKAIVFAIASTIALCAEAQIQILGFHSERTTPSFAPIICEPLQLQTFTAIVSALQAEVGDKMPTPTLRQCLVDIFSSTAISPLHKDRMYFVTVPVSFDRNKKSLPPVLAHEIYHIFQYSRFGTHDDVIDYYGGDVRTVELAADFGAGYLTRRMNLHKSYTYEMNPFLAGDFETDQPNHHGKPSERTLAFRAGMFFEIAVSRAYGLENAERYFLSLILEDLRTHYD